MKPNTDTIITSVCAVIFCNAAISRACTAEGGGGEGQAREDACESLVTIRYPMNYLRVVAQPIALTEKKASRHTNLTNNHTRRRTKYILFISILVNFLPDPNDKNDATNASQPPLPPLPPPPPPPPPPPVPPSFFTSVGRISSISPCRNALSTKRNKKLISFPPPPHGS